MTSPNPRITLCGRLSVVWDGKELGQALPGRQGRLLFAFLVLNRRRPVRRDELVEALWADEGLPSGGEGLLAPPLSRLRKALGPGKLEGRSELGLSLGDEAWIDWEAAEEGIELREEPFTRFEVIDADEMFLTGTAAEVVPVVDADEARRFARGIGPAVVVAPTGNRELGVDVLALLRDPSTAERLDGAALERLVDGVLTILVDGLAPPP